MAQEANCNVYRNAVECESQAQWTDTAGNLIAHELTWSTMLFCWAQIPTHEAIHKWLEDHIFTAVAADVAADEEEEEEEPFQAEGHTFQGVELQEEEAYPVVEVHPFLEAFLVGEEGLPCREEDLASSVEAPWVSGHREVAFLALPSAEAVQEEVAFLAWSLEHPEVLHIEQEDPLDLLEVLPWAAFLEEAHQEEELA